MGEQLDGDLAVGHTKRNLQQFTCFKLANEEYAVDIKSVQEVIRPQEITPIPQMPEYALGVLNIRGSIVPVFDLRLKLHLQSKEMNTVSKIVVINVEENSFSFIVDEILDNIKLGSNQIDPAPTVKLKVDRECVKGLGELEGRMITILNTERIHADIIKDIQDAQDQR